MENLLTQETEVKPFLFDFLEEFEIISGASAYTNLGMTKENGSLTQDSDDE